MRPHNRRPTSEYRALLDRKQLEQLTYHELAAESGVPISTLQYWGRKLRSETAPSSTSESAFIQVDLTNDVDANLEVITSCGVRISVRPGFDPATLRALVDALGC
ncbi:MAG: hypothetical protein AAGG01_01920 [Planctomycetota bacterium]